MQRRISGHNKSRERIKRIYRIYRITTPGWTTEPSGSLSYPIDPMNPIDPLPQIVGAYMGEFRLGAQMRYCATCRHDWMSLMLYSARMLDNDNPTTRRTR